MATPLAEILNRYLAHRGWSFERLAEAADLPRNTVYRWTRGEVKRVRHWHDLATAAHALDLTRSQASALLRAGGHPAIDDLIARATTEADHHHISRWATTAADTLPAQLTSFVGRDAELAHVTHLLASARLVTLTGTGGSGKTRLAIEAARAALDTFDEVCFVDLAATRDPERVVPTIARTLGLGESPDAPPLLALLAHLRDQRTLLLLDNFEQVVEAAPAVAALLAGAHGLKALVTSRTRLNIRGEHELRVPPLALPCSPAFAHLAHSPAVTLFADRARAADPAFALTADTAPLVAEICTRLEGLPLGIELAAARTRQVPLGSMLRRFPGRLVLASDGPRDAPGRQRTLRATIGWSCDLLGPDERRLFHSAGVFVGGFTAEAAESVCAALGPMEIPASVGLEALVEQNLLRRGWGPHGEPRYEMLETVREYALERLGQHGCLEAAASAAARYYLELAERADTGRASQATWLPRLEPELDNFRAVLGWCRERCQIEMGMRLSLALMPLWQLRDLLMEASAWLDAFMTAEGVLSPTLRARGLLWRGLLLLRVTGDASSAARLFDEAYGLFRDAGDLTGLSETLQAEGDILRNQGEWERAIQRYAESLELGRQAASAYLVAHGYMGLALCAQETGQFDRAQRHWERTLAWAERADNGATVSLALNSLGEMARHRGEWAQAERYYGQALALARELGSAFRMALALHNLGYVAQAIGEPGRARAMFLESLSLYEGRRYDKGIAECLAGLARVEAAAGRPERAATLCGAAEAILARLGTRLDTLDRADYERTLGTLRGALGERLEPLLDAGRSMSMPAAATHARTGCRAVSVEATHASAGAGALSASSGLPTRPRHR